MRTLQEVAKGRVITAHGLTKGFRVRAGTGQGCNCAPNRANVDLSPLQWTLERLVTGYRLPTRRDRRLATVNMLWFADDANTVAMSASAVSVALGVTWMVAWMSGNQVGVAEDGSKTAFSVSGLASGNKGGGRSDIAHRYEMILASGERVPSLRKYKLLGTLVDYSVSEAETVDKAVRRSVTAVRLMSRLGGAERRRASRLWLVIPRGVAGFYGRSQGWSLAQAEAVGVAQRKALSRQGHRHWRGARLQVYAPEAAGGLGEPHMYAIAAAAMVDEFDRALSGGRYDPARVSAESAIAATAVRLGFVPSAAQPTPLDWYPEHLEQHLREDVNVARCGSWCSCGRGCERAALQGCGARSRRGTARHGGTRATGGGGWCGKDRGCAFRRSCARLGCGGTSTRLEARTPRGSAGGSNGRNSTGD